MSYRFSSKLERDIVRKVGTAIGDYDLIQDNDHLLVAVSGGKDSLTMLEALWLLQKRSPIQFEITAVTVDQGVPGFSTEWIAQRCESKDIPYQVTKAPIRQIVEEKMEPGKAPCSLCSRLRRGVLYNVAPILGCNKIALGHHLDDLIETLLLNLFYVGQLRSMAPRFLSDDRRNTVIRPLCYVEESWLVAYSKEQGFHTIDCGVGGCGGPTRRNQMKQWVSEIAERSPGVRGHALHALKNVNVKHLLDRALQHAIGD